MGAFKKYLCVSNLTLINKMAFNLMSCCAIYSQFHFRH